MNEQTSKHFPDSFFRVTIKGLCVRDGKVLLQKESAEKGGKWEILGGGLDFGESTKDALIREILEETGLNAKVISDKPIYVWTHKYINKRNMDWFYSFVVTYPIELESLDFTQSKDCTELKFFSLDELKQIDLKEQTNGLVEYFNPDDFTNSIT